MNKKQWGTSTTSRLTIVVLLFSLAFAAFPKVPAYAATVLYVDASATGSQTGDSWANAFTGLQAGLAAAASGDEIWVAAGLYLPGENRSATFQLKSGVSLYGGFPPGGGDPGSRDFAAHPSILSGDIGTPGNSSDNSYHVVTGSLVDSSAVLDGFTIRAGNASGSLAENYFGGGMYIDNGSPVLRNITFESNTASSGGGLFNKDGGPQLLRVTFVNNTANGKMNTNFSGGGGMYTIGGAPELVEVTFRSNTAACMRSYSGGGGLYNRESSLSMLNAIFTENSTSGSDYFNCGGGAIYNEAAGSLTLANSLFTENSADNTYLDSGGGAIYNHDASLAVSNATFSGNTTSGSGKVVFNTGSAQFEIANSILWGNDSPGSPFETRSPASTAARYSIVQGGFGGEGNLDQDPQFLDPAAGDLRVKFSSPAIDSGDNEAVPADTADLDEDGDTTEPLSLDLGQHARFFDLPVQPNVGKGTFPLVDLGAFECYNGAPVLDNQGDPFLAPLLEDESTPAGTPVAALIASGAAGDPISDPDAGAVEGIALVAADSAHGAWQFSLDGGASWQSTGDLSESSALLLGSGADDWIRFLPAEDFNGSIDPALTFRAWDQSDGLPSGTAGINLFTSGGASPYSAITETASLEVTAVNDVPSLDPLSDQAVDEDSGPFFIDLDGIGPGAVNETQTLTLTVLTSNPALLAEPLIDYASPSPTATLQLNPLENEFGTTTITVTVTDSGGSENGGTGSLSRSFDLAVNPVNDAPGFTQGKDIEVQEDSGLVTFLAWASEIRAGPANEADQALAFTLDSSQPAWFIMPPAIQASTGNLTFTPAMDVNGSLTVTVELKDDGGNLHGGLDSFSSQFTLTIKPVNDKPLVSSFNKLVKKNETLQFTAEDFNEHFYDVDGDSLSKIKITALPGAGTLLLDGEAVSLGQEIAAHKLDGLTFVAKENWVAGTSFQWTGSDGRTYAEVASVVSIGVSPFKTIVFFPVARGLFPEDRR